MKIQKGIRQSLFVCSAVLLAAVIGSAPPAWAQGKNGGGTTGGTAAGTIYFINGAGGGYNANYLWSMTANGSNVAQLGAWGRLNVPSRALHNSQRWYLTTLSIPGEYYPDGSLRSEVFALREDYNPANPTDTETRVQLTNDPTLQPYFGWFQGMHWLPGDTGISFKARRWDATAPVEGGLYTAELVYRADGNVAGITAPPTSPTLAFALDASGVPMVGRHSWGATSTKVAYIDNPETGLWVADLSTGTRTRIHSGSIGYLDWAQDGSKILFGSGTIRTIQPTGKGLKTVLSPRYVGNVWVSAFAHAYFDPTGGFITCVGVMNLSGGQDNDVIRATSTGGAVTNLTNSPALVEVPVGWRQ